jgi:spore maturation protein CgeB
MKSLLLPLCYGAEKQQGIIEAFKELGHEVEVFDYFQHYHNAGSNQRNVRTMLIEVAKRFKPDLVYCQIQHTVILDHDTLRAIRTYCPNVKIVQFTVDVRSYIQGPYFNISKIADMNLICSTGQIKMYQDNGVPNVHFLQVGYSPSLHTPEIEPKESYDFDVTFVANVNNVENYPDMQNRLDSVAALRKAFGSRFALYGWGWPGSAGSLGSIDIDKVFSMAYSKSFCNVSISHFNNISHYFSDRLLHCMASQRPCISWYFPEYESYFVDKQDLVIAHNPDDIVNKVKWLLDNKDKANLIGMNGSNKVFAEHTYLSRIKEMLDMVGIK